MANGTAASEEYVVVARVRPGCKRELAFVLKAHSEVSGSIGRTRSRRTQARVPTSPVPLISRNKRLKKSEDDSEKADRHAGIICFGGAKDVEKEEVRTVVVDHKPADLMSVEESKSKSNAVYLEEENQTNFGSPVDCYLSDVVPGNVEQNSVTVNVKGVGSTAYEDGPHEVVTGSTENCKDGSKKESESEENPITKDGLSSKRGYSLMPQNPMRRFTRSQLKPTADEMERAVSSEAEKSANLKLKPKADDMEKTMSLEAEKPANLTMPELESIVTPPGSMATKLEMKMSKKIGLKKPFLVLKDFLDTGLLEGLHVKYSRGVRSSHQGRACLGGVISGSGILCSCINCNGLQVVSPTVFELHAGSSNKRPPESILLENGRSLRDVMNAVRDSPLATLEEAVQVVLGPLSLSKCTLCLNCKGLIGESCSGRPALLCHICSELKEHQVSPVVVPNARSPESCLTMKSSTRTSKVSSSERKVQGKLTRKDLRLHKLVFEDDVLPDGTEVAYYVRGKKMLVGYKRGHGIFCTCCSSVISASSFEAHAGFAPRRKPYLNIYSSNGVSLHELALSILRTRRVSNNDDLCSICYDGGDLLCCDTCPRAFHLECVPLLSTRVGGWNCRYCQNMFQKERFVERNANALAAGRVLGADAIAQITKRCIRMVKTAETTVGGCALCRSQSFTKSGFGPRTVIICDQCEKEYHVGCLRDHKMANLKDLPEGKWFCCVDCQHIHSGLEKLVVQGEQDLPDTLMDIVKKKFEEKDSTSRTNLLDIRWRVLNMEMDSSDESRSLLSESVAIFHERFDPIADSTGRDLIPAMIYGRSYKGQEFSGMFSVILIVNQAVVSAGILRIFGVEAAELPLVATSTDCQGQGYFQSLFAIIERVLASFSVKKLVLPAAEEAESIWTKKLMFEKPKPEELMELRGKHHMMIFDGTSVLQKPVPEANDFCAGI